MNIATENVYATRILRMLVLPFNKQQAFKFGIIDAEGNKNKEPKTQEEKNSYTLLHQVVFSIKRLIEQLPAGSTRLTQLAVALHVIKQTPIPQQYQEHFSDEYKNKSSQFLKQLDFILENNLRLIQEEVEIEKEIEKIQEEGENTITNITGSVQQQEPVIPPNKKKKTNDVSC